MKALCLIVLLAAQREEERLVRQIAAGLPPHAYCAACRDLSSDWYRWQEKRWGEDWLTAEMIIVAHRNRVWDYAAKVTDCNESMEDRRYALLELIDETSWREVVTGQLPLPVPLEWYCE